LRGIIDIFEKKKRKSYYQLICKLFPRIQIVYKGECFWLFEGKNGFLECIVSVFQKILIVSHKEKNKIYNTNIDILFARYR
jgi:hypothetical protein